MAYRDELEALNARCESLERDLRDLDARAREVAEDRTARPKIQRELEQARAGVRALRDKKPLPMLDSIRIASPCKASWEKMTGDDRVRFCGECKKSVYNLSSMARDEAEALLRDGSGNLCVRLYQRTDGTVMTNDCPVGKKRKRVRRLIAAGVGGTLLSAGGLMMASVALMGKPPDPHAMGAIARPPEPMQGEPSFQEIMPAPPSTVPALMGSAMAPLPAKRVAKGSR